MKTLSIIAGLLCTGMTIIFGQNIPTEILHRKLLFDAGKSEIRHFEQIILREVVDSIRLANIGDYEIELIGHTDTTGDVTYNQILSEKRSEAVAQFLKERGVPTRHIQLDAFGENAPLTESTTAEGKQLNRRVELFVVWKEKPETVVATSKSNNPKSSFPDTKPPEKLNPENLFERLRGIYMLESFSLKASSTQNTSFRTRNNTVFSFLPGTFDIGDNTEIKITVKELTKRADVFLQNLNTQTGDDNVFVSDALVYLDFKTSDGVLVAPIKNYLLLLPRKNVGSLSLYDAVLPEEESTALKKIMPDKYSAKNFRWESSQVPNKISGIYDRLDIIKNKKLVLESLLKRLTDTSGCSKMLVFKKYTSHGETRNGKKIQVTDTTTIYSDHASEGFILTGANERDETISPLCYDIAEEIEEAKLSLGKDLQKKYRRIQRKEFWDIYKTFDAFVYADEPQGHGLFAKSARKKIGSYDTLIQHINDRIGSLNKEEIDNLKMTEDYRSRIDSLRKLTTIAKNTNVLIDTTSAYAIFEQKQTGWMNFGYALNADKKNVVDLKTNIPEKDLTTRAKLIFKRRKIVVDAVIKEQFLTFDNIPRGEDVVIVAYKIINGKLQVAMQDWVSDDDIVLLEFQEMSPETLKEKLALLE